jgi:hypothetical protein
MMNKLTDSQWHSIDELLFADLRIEAIQAYRENTRLGIHQSMDATEERKQYLMAKFPERFKSDAEYRAEAHDRLQAIRSKILVIEGSWDGDTWGWHIRLSAITEEPSWQHRKYTEYGLYSVCGMDRQVERAIEFGTELARSAGVDYYLTDDNTDYINYEKRWWDDHG